MRVHMHVHAVHVLVHVHLRMLPQQLFHHTRCIEVLITPIRTGDCKSATAFHLSAEPVGVATSFKIFAETWSGALKDDLITAYDGNLGMGNLFTLPACPRPQLRTLRWRHSPGGAKPTGQWWDLLFVKRPSASRAMAHEDTERVRSNKMNAETDQGQRFHRFTATFVSSASWINVPIKLWIFKNVPISRKGRS